MIYIKKFQNVEALLVLVGKSYTGDQLIHIFLDKFHQGEKYTAHLKTHQAELRREGRLTYQDKLSVTSIRTDSINLDSSSGSGRNS